MRTIKQPGKELSPRLLSVAARAGAHLRITVPAGADLLNGIADALGKAGVGSAAVTLGGGAFARMQYLTGEPDKSGARVATYGAPTKLEGPVRLVGGNAFLGRDEDDKPIMHGHAVVVDREGRVHGGHLPPGTCIADRGGIVCYATAFAGAALAVRYDSETNYPIFHPEKRP